MLHALAELRALSSLLKQVLELGHAVQLRQSTLISHCVKPNMQQSAQITVRDSASLELEAALWESESDDWNVVFSQ